MFNIFLVKNEKGPLKKKLHIFNPPILASRGWNNGFTHCIIPFKKNLFTNLHTINTKVLSSFLGNRVDYIHKNVYLIASPENGDIVWNTFNVVNLVSSQENEDWYGFYLIHICYALDNSNLIIAILIIVVWKAEEMI